MIAFVVSATFAVCSMVLTSCPVEFLVNCSGFPGKERVRISFVYETVDGRIASGSAEVGPGHKPWLMVFMMTDSCERDGWQFVRLSDFNNLTAFLIQGTEKSPIKSVEITGDGWQPTIERRFLPPAKGPPK